MLTHQLQIKADRGEVEASDDTIKKLQEETKKVEDYGKGKS